MHTSCYFWAISCLLGYKLQGNQILVKIGSEFMELSSKPMFIKIQFSVSSGIFYFWQKARYLFKNLEKELNTSWITNLSLNFYDTLYFLQFVCFYKNLGLKYSNLVFFQKIYLA